MLLIAVNGILKIFVIWQQEVDNYLTQYRLDAVHQINDRLQHEVAGVDRICNLFETALNEKYFVRHEILFIDDHFYLNPDNVVYSNIPPSQPFPLLEEEYPGVLTVNNLEKITRQLFSMCPNRRISIVAFSKWLMNYTKYNVPTIE